jgi:hypothetical protein
MLQFTLDSSCSVDEWIEWRGPNTVPLQNEKSENDQKTQREIKSHYWREISLISV